MSYQPLEWMLQRFADARQATFSIVRNAGARRASGAEQSAADAGHRSSPILDDRPSSEAVVRSSPIVINNPTFRESRSELLQRSNVGNAETGTPSNNGLRLHENHSPSCDTPRFSADAPQIIQVPEAGNSVTALTLSQEVIDQLLSIVQNRRALDALSGRLTLESGKFLEEDQAISEAIERIEHELQKLQEEAACAEETPEQLSKSIRKRQRMLDRAHGRREELSAKENALDGEEYEAFKHHIGLAQQLESIFEAVLVSKGYLKPRPKAEEPALEDDREDENSDTTSANSPSAIANPSRFPGRLHQGEGDAISTEAPAPCDEQRPATTEDDSMTPKDRELMLQRQRVSQELGHARWALDDAEEELACYMDGDKNEVTFECHQQYMRYEEGIEVTSEEFGRYQFNKLQRLTRAVVDAEAAYEAAKTRARPFGVNHKHDRESVLSAWTDDEYLWMENDEARKAFASDMDHTSVRKWLKNLEGLAEQDEAERYCPSDVKEEQRLASANAEDSRMEEVDVEEVGPVEPRKPFLSLSMRAGDVYASRRECERRRMLIRRWHQQIGHY